MVPPKRGQSALFREIRSWGCTFLPATQSWRLRARCTPHASAHRMTVLRSPLAEPGNTWTAMWTTPPLLPVCGLRLPSVRPRSRTCLDRRPVEDRQPDRDPRIRPGGPTPGVGRNGYTVPGRKLARRPVLEPQACPAAHDHHPLMFVLVVPPIDRRGMPLRHYP